LLPNPTRLIIDIHGKTGSREQGVASRDAVGAKAEMPMASANVPMVSAVGPVRGGGVETSSLPPMPVTDGSSGFGLPTRGAEERGGRTVAVAQPRVVISSKPTSARPVPNTVAKSSMDNGSEVAAVSRQPGKVEATRKPTSGPVSSGSREQGPATRAGGGFSAGSWRAGGGCAAYGGRGDPGAGVGAEDWADCDRCGAWWA
jgi:N-acetylmuramoyl-L-alanine amidase